MSKSYLNLVTKSQVIKESKETPKESLKDAITTLDHEFLATIPERADSYIIYADLCTIPAEELAKYNITFKKIPRDIAKL